MNSQFLYLEDITKLEFDAEVVEIRQLPRGRLGVVLDHSYFYPTGGGQEHDIGEIGGVSVVDVFKDEETDLLVHVVEAKVPLSRVHAHIDAERRLRHMQHHTAQHLLTQCILRQTGYETVSANINGYSPSTLDVVAPQLMKSDLDQAELIANQIIYQDKSVKTYFVTPEELHSLPLRRPPKVTENIRIVEIEDFDYSPCGGTHVLSTGSIGSIKVLKAEKQNDKQRVYFIAGLQALEVFHQVYDELTVLANQMSIGWQDVPDMVRKQAEQLSVLQRELHSLHQAQVRYEAEDLISVAEKHQDFKLIRAAFENRPLAELRLLADELKNDADIIAYLASYDGQKVSLLVTCGEDVDKDARQLLIRQLARIHGRGGGDSKLAQGGGVASEDQYRALLQQIELG